MHVIINYSCTIVHNVSYRQISFKDIAKDPKKSAFWKDNEYNKQLTARYHMATQ